MQHFKAASDLDAERGAGAHGRACGQGTDSHHPRLGPAGHGQLQLLGQRRPAGHHLRGGQGHRYLGPGQGGASTALRDSGAGMDAGSVGAGGGPGNSSLARGDEGGSCHSLQGGRCSARGCRTLGSPAMGPACPCCLGKGHHSSAPADPNHCPLAPPGEEEAKNVSCQADSYRGSFRCSWTGPRSAVFRARLMRRWVPATLAPAPWAPSAHARLASQ